MSYRSFHEHIFLDIGIIFDNEFKLRLRFESSWIAYRSKFDPSACIKKLPCDITILLPETQRRGE